MKKIIIDIDNTVCKTIDSDYKNSEPIFHRIEFINSLYNEGNHITYWTARGATTGIDWKDLTIQQLHNWGCLYNDVMFGKPAYDIWVDDKAINLDFFK
jgi:hypothetical protein